jgi:hypothetical protein
MALRTEDEFGILAGADSHCIKQRIHDALMDASRRVTVCVLIAL